MNIKLLSKNRYLYPIIALALYGVSLFHVNTHSANEQKSIALVMREHSPYNIDMSSDYVYKRVACSLTQMNYIFKVTEYPWKRAQRSVQQNFAHGFFPGATNSEREENFIRSEAINEGYIYWVSLKSKQLSQDDLQEGDIGVVRGTNAFKWAKRNSLNIREVGDQTSLFTMLHLGRLSKVLTSKESLKEFNISLLSKEHVITQAYKRSQYIFFSKDFILTHPHFLEQFNAYIEACTLQHSSPLDDP
jgi:ABC-type amino acid transport substrate-binding protein